MDVGSLLLIFMDSVLLVQLEPLETVMNILNCTLQVRGNVPLFHVSMLTVGDFVALDSVYPVQS